MQAGRLRHRITLQEPVKSQGSIGQTVNTWQTYAVVWAEVNPSSVREFVSAQAFQNEVTGRITLRYRDDVTAKHRVLYRGQIYNIEGVFTDPNSGLEYITLATSEGLNDG